MTNNIERIEQLLNNILSRSLQAGNAEKVHNAMKSMESILTIVKSMQSQIDALKQEADEDESRESESL